MLKILKLGEVKTHNHQPNSTVYREAISNNLKRRALDDLYEKPGKLIHSELQKLPTIKMEQVTPKDISNIRKCMYRKRRTVLPAFRTLSAEVNNADADNRLRIKASIFSNVCAVEACKKTIKSGEKALKCDGECGQWYHAPCLEIEPAKYEQIREIADLILWMCPKCLEAFKQKPNVQALHKSSEEKPKEKVGEENNLPEIMQQIMELKDQIKKLKMQEIVTKHEKKMLNHSKFVTRKLETRLQDISNYEKEILTQTARIDSNMKNINVALNKLAENAESVEEKYQPPQ